MTDPKLYFVGSESATAIATETCLCASTAGAHVTTPIRFTTRDAADAIAQALGDEWQVTEHPWPSQPSVGPAVFDHGYNRP